MINVCIYIKKKKEEGEENFRLNLESRWELRFINANLSINRLDGLVVVRCKTSGD